MRPNGPQQNFGPVTVHSFSTSDEDSHLHANVGTGTNRRHFCSHSTQQNLTSLRNTVTGCTLPERTAGSGTAVSVSVPTETSADLNIFIHITQTSHVLTIITLLFLVRRNVHVHANTFTIKKDNLFLPVTQWVKYKRDISMHVLGSVALVC
jgi:hypothetical protein